jgi:hypothetical protein
MQSYYRNVALWLSNASQRRQLMTASVWNVLAHSSPMDFNAAQTHWEMGQLVIERMTPMLGASWVNELAASHVDATRLYRTNPPVHGVGRPEWGRLPEDVVNRVVVGSLAKALYPQVRELRRDLTRKTDVRVDEEAVEKLVSEATARVPGLLSEAIAESIDGMTRLRESLGSRRD